jgi:hypothetical protein
MQTATSIVLAFIVLKLMNDVLEISISMTVLARLKVKQISDIFKFLMNSQRHETSA